MNLKQKVTLAGLVGIAGLAGYKFYQGMKSNEAERDHYTQLTRELHVGDNAPNFSLPSLQDGKTISLSNLEDKLVLLDFWSLGCGPCRALTPSLEKMYQECKDYGLEIVQISTKNKRKDLDDYVKEHMPSFPLVYDSDNSLWQDYCIQGLPTLVLVEKGKVKAISNGMGSMTEKFLERIKDSIKKKK